MFHGGMGGTGFWPDVKELEERADVATVMVR